MRQYFLLLLFACFSCKSKTTHAISDKWFEKTKQLILNQSVNVPDTIIRESNKSLVVKSVRTGESLIHKTFGDDLTQESQTNFSVDGLFEIRKEFCPNERISFEGIFYKGEPYGLSTWWHCDGSIKEQGIRYKTMKIGWWKEEDRRGKKIEINYGNDNYIDSLELIKLN